uniref:Uncharacterized protein n=1 Tax=Aegilops tauschii subsp. strangulata TaxID=200361 RepID=A0A453HS32_AEGTS
QMYRSKKIDHSGQVIIGHLQQGGQVYNYAHLPFHHRVSGAGTMLSRCGSTKLPSTHFVVVKQLTISFG